MACPTGKICNFIYADFACAIMYNLRVGEGRCIMRGIKSVRALEKRNGFCFLVLLRVLCYARPVRCCIKWFTKLCRNGEFTGSMFVRV